MRRTKEKPATCCAVGVRAWMVRAVVAAASGCDTYATTEVTGSGCDRRGISGTPAEVSAVRVVALRAPPRSGTRSQPAGLRGPAPMPSSRGTERSAASAARCLWVADAACVVAANSGHDRAQRTDAIGDTSIVRRRTSPAPTRHQGDIVFSIDTWSRIGDRGSRIGKRAPGIAEVSAPGCYGPASGERRASSTPTLVSGDAGVDLGRQSVRGTSSRRSGSSGDRRVSSGRRGRRSSVGRPSARRSTADRAAYTRGMALPRPRQMDDAHLERLRRWSDLLDQAFRIPGTNIRFGWDVIVGLVPGIGDLSSPLFGTLLLIQAYRMRVPALVQARMVINAIVDALLGVVPGLGNIADIFWKANTWNMRLLERHARPGVPHSQIRRAVRVGVHPGAARRRRDSRGGGRVVRRVALCVAGLIAGVGTGDQGRQRTMAPVAPRQHPIERTSEPGADLRAGRRCDLEHEHQAGVLEVRQPLLPRHATKSRGARKIEAQPRPLVVDDHRRRPTGRGLTGRGLGTVMLGPRGHKARVARPHEVVGNAGRVLESRVGRLLRMMGGAIGCRGCLLEPDSRAPAFSVKGAAYGLPVQRGCRALLPGSTGPSRGTAGARRARSRYRCRPACRSGTSRGSGDSATKSAVLHEDVRHSSSLPVAGPRSAIRDPRA